MLVRSNPNLSEAGVYWKEVAQQAALHSPALSTSDSGSESCARSRPAHVAQAHHISETGLLLLGLSHQPCPQGRDTRCCSAAAGAPEHPWQGLALCRGCRAPPATSPAPARRNIPSPRGHRGLGLIRTLLPFEQSNQVLCHRKTLLPGFPRRESLWVTEVLSTLHHGLVTGIFLSETVSFLWPNGTLEHLD